MDKSFQKIVKRNFRINTATPDSKPYPMKKVLPKTIPTKPKRRS